MAVAVDPLSLYAIATSRKTKENHVVDLETGKVLMRFSTGVTTTSLRFSTDGNFLVSSDLNGALYVWRVADIKARRSALRRSSRVLLRRGTQRVWAEETVLQLLARRKRPLLLREVKAPTRETHFSAIT